MRCCRLAAPCHTRISYGTVDNGKKLLKYFATYEGMPPQFVQGLVALPLSLNFTW
jgi:hypothetical protein